MTTYYLGKAWLGEYRMPQGAACFTASASGNAQQRRVKVRRWKRLGWTVEQRATGVVK